jgi:hypothetical protein
MQGIVMEDLAVTEMEKGTENVKVEKGTSDSNERLSYHQKIPLIELYLTEISDLRI